MFHGLVAQMKGLETFIRMIPLVKEKMPQTRFVIVGEGPALPKIKRLAEQLQLGTALQFTGWVPFKDIPNYLVEATIGIPCRSGNLGNHFVVTTALLQYWAMGKPVVAPDMEAMRDSVKHGVNGLLFRPDDPQSLAKNILHLLENPSLSQSMADEGRKTAEQKFNVDLVSDRMLSALGLKSHQDQS
jgi:glycosyltransferase involved in cell wall biosynthesis